MNELDTAIFCETHNRMNHTDRQRREKEDAYSMLQNMSNMVKEYSRENDKIPWRGKPSRKIQTRYGIHIDSDFNNIWFILEKVCNGEFILKPKEDVQSER